MLTYCLKCKKITNTANIDPTMIKNNNGKLMLASKYAVCGNKKINICKTTRSKSIIK